MSGKGFLEQPELHTKAPFRAAVLTYPANFKEALSQAQADPRKILIGVAQGIPSVFLTKVLVSPKPDFVWFDVEHAVFDRSSLYDAVHAAQHHSEGKTMVVVRVPENDEVVLTTALDAGASAIVMPHTESAEEVKEMIQKMYYPPIGRRSFSPWTFTPGISDASLYAGDSFNMTNSNKHVCLIPQIESVKGLANIEEIAAVPGIAALMFGPGDYCADAGIPLTFQEPEFFAAVGKVTATAKKFNLPLFGAAMAMAQVPSMIDQGFAAIAVVFDVWGIAGMVSSAMAEARKAINEKLEGANGVAEGSK